jgi:hypothetical protein
MGQAKSLFLQQIRRFCSVDAFRVFQRPILRVLPDWLAVTLETLAASAVYRTKSGRYCHTTG